MVGVKDLFLCFAQVSPWLGDRLPTMAGVKGHLVYLGIIAPRLGDRPPTEVGVKDLFPHWSGLRTSSRVLLLGTCQVTDPPQRSGLRTSFVYLGIVAPRLGDRPPQRSGLRTSSHIGRG